MIYYPARDYWKTAWKALLLKGSIQQIETRLVPTGWQSHGQAEPAHLLNRRPSRLASSRIPSTPPSQAKPGCRSFAFLYPETSCATVEARNLSRMVVRRACGEVDHTMQHPSRWRMPPENGSGHLLPLRALVFEPCVGGIKACETAFLEVPKKNLACLST